MRLRSLLYVPAHAEKFIAKAHLRDADAIILDLEDSVPSEHKQFARDNLATNVKSVKQNGAKVLIRVNNQIEYLVADLSAGCNSGADGIILPKLQNKAQLKELDHILTPIESALNRTAMFVYGLIEDAIGVLNALDIAQHTRIIGIGLGSEDFSNSINARPDPDVLYYPKMQLHLAAKAAGKFSFGLLQSIANFSDLDKYAMAVNEAKRFGFDGSTCVHPSSVPLLNVGFDFTNAEIHEAEQIIEAAKIHQSSDIGAFTLNGKMIDQPHIERAKLIMQSRD